MICGKPSGFIIYSSEWQCEASGEDQRYNPCERVSCGKTILRPSSSLNLTRSKAVSSPGNLDSWDKIYSKRKRISLSHGQPSAASASAAAVGVP